MGTEDYWSPEQWAVQLYPDLFGKQTFRTDLIDVFQCGVVLFMTLCMRHPWLRLASPHDEIFNYMFTGDFDTFWSIYEKYELSDEVRDLIQKMLAPEKNRITLEQVKNHPWMSMEQPDKRQIRSCMKERQKEVEKEFIRQEEEYNMKLAEREKMQRDQINQRNHLLTRDALGGNSDNFISIDINGITTKIPDKRCYDYVPSGMKYDLFNFFTDQHPFLIEDNLVQYLRSKQKQDVELDQEKYTLDFNLYI